VREWPPMEAQPNLFEVLKQVREDPLEVAAEVGPLGCFAGRRLRTAVEELERTEGGRAVVAGVGKLLEDGGRLEAGQLEALRTLLEGCAACPDLVFEEISLF
jgi:hypothetical protein